MQQASKRRSVWSIPFVLVILISFASTCIVDALQAALPVYVQQSGGTSTLGGLTVTAFALSAILPSLLAGSLADCFGCRRVMLYGGVIFLTGVAATLSLTGNAALLCLRVVQGVGFAVLSVTSAAGASNVLPQERLGEGLGYFGVGQSLSMALGPMTGLWLLSLGIKAMWLSFTGIAAFILAVSFFCHCDRRGTETELPVRPKLSLRGIIERRAVLPALMIFIFCTGICSMIVFSGQYAMHKGYGNAGPFFILAAAAMLGVRFCSGLFMDRFRAVTILLPSMVLGGLTFLLPGLFPSRAVFYLTGLLFGLSFGLAMPLLSALAVKRTPKSRWGAANATYYLCLNLGFGSGAFCGGVLIDRLDFERALLCGVLSALLPALLGFLFLRGPNAERPL